MMRTEATSEDRRPGKALSWLKLLHTPQAERMAPKVVMVPSSQMDCGDEIYVLGLSSRLTEDEHGFRFWGKPTDLIRHSSWKFGEGTIHPLVLGGNLASWWPYIKYYLVLYSYRLRSDSHST
jgi:hypothetical protein